MWNIDFLHDGHVHPGQVIAGSKTGSFTIPTSGHDFEGNTRYRISLTVTDSSGLTTRSGHDLAREGQLDLRDGAGHGLTLYLDGIARTAPFTVDTLIGFNHAVEARNQTVGNNVYTFASWSDGGAQTHVLQAPSAAQSYTASFTGAPAAPTGLMVAWGFNEGAGTSAADSSGNNNTATLLNGVTWGTGKYGSGLSFDGANDYLSVPNSPSLNITGTGLTLSTWLKPSTASTAIRWSWASMEHHHDLALLPVRPGAPDQRHEAGIPDRNRYGSARRGDDGLAHQERVEPPGDRLERLHRSVLRQRCTRQLRQPERIDNGTRQSAALGGRCRPGAVLRRTPRRYAHLQPGPDGR